jgi:putative FmdB family regulatory protein
MQTFERRLTYQMPTYEYSCEKCGQNFDAFQSMRDEPFRECPKELCRLPEWGHGKVKRLLGTGAGLIFKGSGFYITDYRSDSYKEAAKKEAPASSSGEKSAAPKESSKGSAPAQTKTSGKKPKKEAS